MEPQLIERARPDEAAALSALAMRSKAHWGYDGAFMEACRNELTYTAEDCASGGLYVARIAFGVAGFAFVTGGAPEGELVALFVDPPWIGQGIGAALLARAVEHARQKGMTRLVLDSDPNAEGFYAHHGARRIGDSPSESVPGRSLPRMVIVVGSGADVG